MPIEPGDFLEYARTEIEDPELSEFKARNAGSRAYYALYHKAKARVETLGLSVARVEMAGSHAGLIETIRRVSPKGKAFAADMDRVKRFRHNCDYDLDIPVATNKVRKQIAEVRRLIDMLDRIE